jgi:RNA-directed RNA polymerase
VIYDEGWFKLALKIQKYLDDGNKIVPVELLRYDEKFKFNIKHPSPENNFLNFRVVVDCKAEVYLDDDDGLSSPAVLRGWEIESIPESIELPDGKMFGLRKACLRRVTDEAPCFLYTNLFNYALLNIDFDSPLTKIWLNHFVGSEDYFTFNGRSFTCNKTLLAHKKFELLITALRAKLKFNVNDDEFEKCLLEGFSIIIDDPIYNSYKCRGLFGDLNQHVFAKTRSPPLPININGISNTTYEYNLDHYKHESIGRMNLIDEKSFEESLEKLRKYGFNENAALLKRSPFYDITKLNCKKGKLNRMILGLCGYTGTHGSSAVITQFMGTSDMGPEITPSFYEKIRHITHRFYTDAEPSNYVLKPEQVLDVLYKGGTSSASSTNNHLKLDMVVKYRSPFFTNDDVIDDKVVLDNKSNEYIVNTKVKTKFKTKNAAILTHPQDFIFYKNSDMDIIVNMGSRLVRGTRDKRIITPNYGSIYATALMTSTPVVRLMSGRPDNMPALTLKGRIGTAYTNAVPHLVMLPIMAATTNDPSFFVICVDYKQFDSSQHGEIAEANADGIRDYSLKFPSEPDYDNNDIMDLRYISMNKKLHLKADHKANELKYTNGDITAVAPGVPSGSLPTQVDNSITNRAATEETIEMYNKEYLRKIELICENVIGDDKCLVFKMSDGRAVTIEVMNDLVDVSKRVAENNHMAISAKRTVVGNNVGEHIKNWCARGYITQDVFLDSLTSEKNSFRELKYADKLTTIYDIFMTMLTRFADTKPLMQLMKQDIILLEGITSGYITFIPTVKTIAAIGGPEILFSNPEIRGMARYAHKFDEVDGFETINRLFSTLRENRGSEAFRSSVLKHVKKYNPDAISEIWINHFKRRNEATYTVEDIEGPYSDVKQYMPEFADSFLMKKLAATLREPVAERMDNNIIIKTIFEFGVLAKFVKPKFFQPFFCEYFEANGYTSPYIGACNRVQRIHELIGLSKKNISVVEPTARLSAIMRQMPGSHPAYITGEDVFAVLSAKSDAVSTWNRLLQLMDFTPGLIERVISFVQQNMHRYISDKDVNLTSIFDNTTRTYDISEDNAKLRVKLNVKNMNLSKTSERGLMVEGMKHVVYAAGHGHSILANYSSMKVGNLTLHNLDEN